MTRWFILPAVLLSLTFTGLHAQPPAKSDEKSKSVDAPKSADTPKPAMPPDAGFYPIKVGTTWTYKVGDKKLSTRVARMEKKGKYDCAVIETIVDGNVVANEHVAVTKEGLYRVANNGQESKEPILFLKLPAKKGESWEVKTDVGGEAVEGKFTEGEEEITVPLSKDKLKTVTSAGEFKINGQDTRFTLWLNEKYGIVKQQLNVGGQDLLLELEKFEEGK